MIPNIENIVCNYLRTHADIVALGARVVQKPPPKKFDPWVEVYKLDDLDAGAAQVEYLINYMVQFDCYAGTGRDADGSGGGVPEAINLKLTVRAVLKEMQDGVFDDARITAVRFAGGPRIHDEAMDREILTAIFFAHPV